MQSSGCCCARARCSRSSSSSRTCTGSMARARPCSTASLRASPLLGCSSSSTTVRRTSIVGAPGPTILSSASIPCLPKAPANSSGASSARMPSESARRLVRSLVGEDAARDPLRARLIERTEGSPLFLEESVRALVETGALTGERGAYRLARSLADIEIPPTVQAILAARIDRLPTEDKRLLQSAAVIGKDVSLSLLAAIAEESEGGLRRRLALLQSAEFIYETSLFPATEYTFKHALTHEVAYGGLLQERRRELHGRILDAIERLHADRLAEHVDRLAHHALRSEAWDKAITYSTEAG